jgi:alanyl-tRNA synthetase
MVQGLAETLRVQPDQLADRVSKMVAQLKDAEREIATLKSKNLLTTLDPIVARLKDIGGVGYVGHSADGVAGGDLRTLALAVRDRLATTPAVVAVIGGTTDKPSVVIVTTEGARQRGLKAGELVRVASETLGGRGGGKDDIAQGGGSDSGQIGAALAAVEQAIGNRVRS